MDKKVRHISGLRMYHKSKNNAYGVGTVEVDKRPSYNGINPA